MKSDFCQRITLLTRFWAFIKTYFLITNMKKFLVPALGCFAAAAFFIDPAFAQLIDINDNPNEIANATNSQGSARQLALTFINFFLFFLGLIATAFIIYGGFLYITSSGDDTATEKAKKILIYSAIGILIILISFALVNTLLTAGLGNRATT